MRIVPLTLRQANAFVREHHRHNDPVGGCKYAIGCMENDALIGVAIAGRPVARHMDDGLTVEIVRLCTNGHPNACSKLYGAALRIARRWAIAKQLPTHEFTSGRQPARVRLDNGGHGEGSHMKPSRSVSGEPFHM